MSEWQPIETAPKDGTWFLTAWGDEVMPAKWIDNSDSDYGKKWQGFIVPSMWPVPRAAKPIHWMPFPDAP